MSVSEDFPGLENLEKILQDFQGPTRALPTGQRQFLFCPRNQSPAMQTNDPGIR